MSARILRIKNLEVVRAGSDYLGTAWSINIAMSKEDALIHLQDSHIMLERDDGTQFEVVPVQEETLDGKNTLLLADAQDWIY